MDISVQIATLNDVDYLAAMNQQLVSDEGHRNKMSLDQLQQRMEAFLNSEYTAAIASLPGDQRIGYALFSKTPEHLYIRQLFIDAKHRRQGHGRTLVAWLITRHGSGVQRLRIDVLATNTAATAFWRSAGFTDYCTTMERDIQSP